MAGAVLAVALMVSGELASPVLVATMVFVPAVAPSVHAPTVATPCAFVVCVAPVTVPPPDVTAKLTSTPATGLLLASFTTTLGGTATT